jgi:hypothetical protein
VAADHTGVRSRRLLIAYSAAVVLLSWPATLGGATWWPWQPLRVVIVGIAAVAVAFWSRRAAVVAICAWARVAAPWTVRQAQAYFAQGAVAPGERLATGVPSRPFLLGNERAPLGLTVLRAAAKNYIDGEGYDADSELVAWSLTSRGPTSTAPRSWGWAATSSISGHHRRACRYAGKETISC